MYEIATYALEQIGLQRLDARDGAEFFGLLHAPRDRPSIIHRTDDRGFILHELGHGWECPDVEIRKTDFGMSDCDVFESKRREARTIGYQAGLMDCHGLKVVTGHSILEQDQSGRPMVVMEWDAHAGTYWSGRVRSEIDELHQDRGNPLMGENAYLWDSICRWHTPSGDSIYRGFLQTYAEALHVGMDGCVREWKRKLGDPS